MTETAMIIRSPFLPPVLPGPFPEPLRSGKDHDSVEKNDKDFAPPIKKLKLDKDVICREIFDKWCKGWETMYGIDEEKESRFAIFQKNLKLAKTVKQLNKLSPYADHTQKELDACYRFNFQNKPDDMFNEEDFAKLKDSLGEEDNTDSDPEGENEKDFVEFNEKEFAPLINKLTFDMDVTSLSAEEMFHTWCYFCRMTYKDDNEKQYRFSIFQKALKPTETQDELRPNYIALADRTEEELDGETAYIFKYDLEIMVRDVISTHKHIAQIE